VFSSLSRLGILHYLITGLSVIQTLNLVPKIQGFMVEVKEYFIRLQTALGKKNAEGKTSAYKINEDLWWNEVMKELNQASFDFADKLQEETGKPYGKYFKDGGKAYDLNYEEAPPIRLLSQALILSYWLGYHDADKGHYLQEEEIGAWKRINEAYENGKLANFAALSQN
jgi:hypothetical protein